MTELTGTALLALLIDREAANQHLEGQIAVANVVMNRVAHPQWSSNVDEVMMQPLQFSCFNQGVPYGILVPDRFHVIAEGAIRGWLVDVTDGATHYHADYYSPEWIERLERIKQIGSHIFYK